ncbi:MAG: hypothetical protein CM1200mP35_07380 [Chloroflexota bacterium]|nr:MAG: hypothetical protein CM1200mP35_07380 [Chloroflexota bacterium]
MAAALGQVTWDNIAHGGQIAYLRGFFSGMGGILSNFAEAIDGRYYQHDVTGPSLTELTCMYSWNFPVSTVSPYPSRRLIK